MVDFQTLPNAHLRQHGPYRGMLYLANFLDVLDVGVNDAMLVIEERWQALRADEIVPVNGEAEHAAPLFAVPGRIVRASPELRHTKRCTSDDHLSPTGP